MAQSAFSNSRVGKFAVRPELAERENRLALSGSHCVNDQLSLSGLTKESGFYEIQVLSGRHLACSWTAETAVHT